MFNFEGGICTEIDKHGDVKIRLSEGTAHVVKKTGDTTGHILKSNFPKIIHNKIVHNNNNTKD